MPNLTFRSYKKELLDGDDIPFEDIKENMKELNSINKRLGGHKITIDGLKEIISKGDQDETISICEIGCGGGDNLQAIALWCKKDLSPSFTGIDIKKTCIEFASMQYPNLPAIWIASDFASADLTLKKPDIIFSSLFCHHFNEQELVFILQWMQKNSSKGFFINDLHRHPLAYFLIKWLTRFFSKSYLVKNDAPLSVTRGFKRKEWEALFSKAGISNFSIQWKWAFRYLIVCKNEG